MPLCPLPQRFFDPVSLLQLEIFSFPLRLSSVDNSCGCEFISAETPVYQNLIKHIIPINRPSMSDEDRVSCASVDIMSSS
jgi:hypothetical protein